MSPKKPSEGGPSNGGQQGAGGGQSTEAVTARARQWPTLRQFAVFLENRVGRLHDLLRRFESHDIRVASLTIIRTKAQSTELAILSATTRIS